jgi:hypothetical protein
MNTSSQPEELEIMQISGEYGTELLLRYTEEQLALDLERRRIVNERWAEIRGEKRRARATLRARFVALLAGNRSGMPAAPAARTLRDARPAHAANR